MAHEWTEELLIIVRVLLGLGLAAYSAYAGASVWAARQWHRARTAPDRDWTPPVTILKPVRGADAYAYDNYVSFCRQDYPADRVQIIFGALDADDPALLVARRLQCEFPERDIAIVTPTPFETRRGHNLKVCNLVSMLPHARHDLLVLCDSDIRVAPDYLRNVVAPFREQGTGNREQKEEEKKRRREEEKTAGQGTGNREQGTGNREQGTVGKQSPIANSQSAIDSSFILHPSSLSSVGLVTCPYRGFQAQSLAARLEALGFGADFIPNALVSRLLNEVDFAFGATMALSQGMLRQIGGFEAILDDLADDFLLGNGVKRAGYRVVIANYMVENVLGAEPFGTMWARRLRWARTVRAYRPKGYAAAIVTQGTTLALLFAIAMGFNRMGLTIFACIIALRIAAAAWIASVYTHDSNVRRYWPLLPLDDLIQSALFIISFCGSHIIWRGQKFRLFAGGKIEQIS